MMAGRKNWSREEHLLAFSLYSRIPFSSIHMKNPEIVKLAEQLGRSVGSVSFKLANFSRLDPALQSRGIKGMPHGAKGEEEVWSEFSKHPEKIIQECHELEHKISKKNAAHDLLTISEDSDKKTTSEIIIQARLNQNYFRRRVLSAYNFKCCVTGSNVIELLNASHIVSWAEDAKNRLNVRNGLALNLLHDRLFDRHLMWIDDDLLIHYKEETISSQLKSDPIREWILSFKGKKLILEKSFTPDLDLLRHHREIAISER